MSSEKERTAIFERFLHFCSIVQYCNILLPLLLYLILFHWILSFYFRQLHYALLKYFSLFTVLNVQSLFLFSQYHFTEIYEEKIHFRLIVYVYLAAGWIWFLSFFSLIFSHYFCLKKQKSVTKEMSKR